MPIKARKLNLDVKQILIGGLLGDGSLEKQAKNASYKHKYYMNKKDE